MAIPTGVKLAPVHVAAAQSYGNGSQKGRTDAKGRGRGRKNSIVKVEEIDENAEQMLDQSLYTNMNVEWVNRKGMSFFSFLSSSCVHTGFCLGVGRCVLRKLTWNVYQAPGSCTPSSS